MGASKIIMTSVIAAMKPSVFSILITVTGFFSPFAKRAAATPVPKPGRIVIENH